MLPGDKPDGLQVPWSTTALLFMALNPHKSIGGLDLDSGPKTPARSPSNHLSKPSLFTCPPLACHLFTTFPFSHLSTFFGYLFRGFFFLHQIDLA